MSGTDLQQGVSKAVLGMRFGLDKHHQENSKKLVKPCLE